MLLHLDCVREDHVQVKHKVLDLEAHRAEYLSYCFPTPGRNRAQINQFGKLNQSRRVRIKWVINQCLVREGGLPELQVLLGVGEDGLQGATQELLVKILRRPHQRRQRHGHLHLHPGKVLKVGGQRGQMRVRKHSKP